MKTITVLLLCAVSACGQISLSGPISGTLVDTTYIVTGDIFVAAGDSLIIEPGAEFLFSGLFSFNVSGYLYSVGTIIDSISFKHDSNPGYWSGINFLDECSDSSCMEYCNVTSSSGNGIEIINVSLAIKNCNISGNHSRGIMISSGASPLIFNCNINSNYGGGLGSNNSSPIIDSCKIKYNFESGFGGGIYSVNDDSLELIDCYIDSNVINVYWPCYQGGGGIYYENTILILNNCSISYNAANYYGNGGGICSYGEDAYIYMTDCIIKGNLTSGMGGGLLCDAYDGNGELYNCEFSFNQSSGSGGAISGLWSGSIIENCQFINNMGHNGGAVQSGAEFYNCIFTLNYCSYLGGAINCLSPGGIGPIIDHCFIFDNYSQVSGGGIYGYCAIYNSTIVNNRANMGGGIKGHFSEFYNNIVANNIGGGIYFNTASSTEFSSFFNNAGGNFIGNVPDSIGSIVITNLNSDSCDIYYNIYQDPFFVDPVNGNYNLQATSPCIDAGDPNSPLDPDSTIADIGAFYFDQSSFAIPDVVITIQGNDIHLQWAPSPLANLYKIYASDNPYFTPAPELLIGTSVTPEFIQQNVVSNGQCFYRIIFEY